MKSKSKKKRYGMIVDLDLCSGCGSCVIACSAENAPPGPKSLGSRTSPTWMRICPVDNGAGYPAIRTAYLPIFCQQCGVRPPCVSACPRHAVEVDPGTGIVVPVPGLCTGCRACIAACPYRARYINWWDPRWPPRPGMNSGQGSPAHGVVEKCNFCIGRMPDVRANAVTNGRKPAGAPEYLPACAEACPNGAIVFGDLNDPKSEAAKLAQDENSFRLLEDLGTEPKVYFRTSRAWVQRAARNGYGPDAKRNGRT